MHHGWKHRVCWPPLVWGYYVPPYLLATHFIQFMCAHTRGVQAPLCERPNVNHYREAWLATPWELSLVNAPFLAYCSSCILFTPRGNKIQFFYPKKSLNKIRVISNYRYISEFRILKWRKLSCSIFYFRMNFLFFYLF